MQSTAEKTDGRNEYCKRWFILLLIFRPLWSGLESILLLLFCPNCIYFHLRWNIVATVITVALDVIIAWLGSCKVLIRGLILLLFLSWALLMWLKATLGLHAVRANHHNYHITVIFENIVILSFYPPAEASSSVKRCFLQSGVDFFLHFSFTACILWWTDVHLRPGLKSWPPCVVAFIMRVTGQDSSNWTVHWRQRCSVCHTGFLFF